MKKFKILNDIPDWFVVALLFDFVLIVASLIMPPLGVIDNSVITAIGELGGMCLIGCLLQFLNR